MYSTHKALSTFSVESSSTMSRVIYQGKTCRFVFGEDCLSVREDDEGAESLLSVLYEDVIGLEVPSALDGDACYSELHIYQKRTPSALVSDRVYLREVLEFSEFENFDTNHRAAMEWRNAIQLQRTRRSKKLFVNTPEQIEKLEPLRLLVIINPFSGKKNSEHLYQSIALPIFEVGGATIVKELITERQGHAKEFIEAFDLSSITGIVLASGDGIVYEVINGLMARPDWETAIKTPIGVLPTGSGNALVSSLLYEADEEVHACAIENAVFQIINGGIKPHDIASVSNSSSHSYIGVVIHWGMTGIVDVESEKLRFLGGKLRNLIGGLLCIAVKRSYYGQLSYLPIEDDETKSPLTESPLTESPLTEAEGMMNSGNSLKPTTDIGVSDPIPEHWKTIEGNFVIFIALTSSHITENDMMCAEAKTGSGKFIILYTFDDVTRGQLLAKLSESTGAVKIENFHEIHTREFRLNPISPCIITVDGEQMEYGPIQVQMHPGMMRLYSRVKCQ